MSAWINLHLLGRGKNFRHADQILTALNAELKQRNFDRIVFSGDATAMGFDEEMRKAAALLGVGAPSNYPDWLSRAITITAPTRQWGAVVSSITSPPGRSASASATRFIRSHSV